MAGVAAETSSSSGTSIEKEVGPAFANNFDDRMHFTGAQDTYKEFVEIHIFPEIKAELACFTVNRGNNVLFPLGDRLKKQEKGQRPSSKL
jgi:hypothetical protein